MVSTSNEKDRIRITIGLHERNQWVPQDIPQSIAMHWLKVGKEREQLRDHFEELLADLRESNEHRSDLLKDEILLLREELNRLTKLIIQISHLIVTSSAVSQYELETIKYKKSREKISQEESNKYNLSLIQEGNFKKVLSALFPDLEQDFLISNFQKTDGSHHA